MATRNKEQLLLEISKTLNKIKTADLAKIAVDEAFLLGDLLELCYHSDKQIAFRASWILEFAENSCPEKFIPFFYDFLKGFPLQKNGSCQRHFTKILMHFTEPKAKIIRKAAFKQVPVDLKEQLVETLFEWLIEPTTPVAVQVNCMEVLCYMIPTFPWIKEELPALIYFYMKGGSAAMQSRGKKILAQIKNI